jgi:uncharacterized membrane protein
MRHNDMFGLPGQYRYMEKPYVEKTIDKFKLLALQE